MTASSEIKAFTDALVAQFSPDKVVLFGSYAYGSAGPDSDVDLLVVMNHEGRASQQALDIRRSLRKSFPLDLIVQSPEEAERRLKMGDPFMTEALSQGRTLYERNQPGMGR
jgi:predicted nucleotidyltransferase